MTEFLQAPCPYLMGVHRSLFSSLPNLSGVVLVDLDEGVVQYVKEATAGQLGDNSNTVSSDNGEEEMWASSEPDFTTILPCELKKKLLNQLKYILTPHLRNFDSAFSSKLPSFINISLPERDKLMLAEVCENDFVVDDVQFPIETLLLIYCCL
tara:strand:- start:587 stop:1045 length:459 start_codon:yes stop_codon:yes gene_type:complete